MSTTEQQAAAQSTPTIEEKARQASITIVGDDFRVGQRSERDKQIDRQLYEIAEKNPTYTVQQIRDAYYGIDRPKYIESSDPQIKELQEYLKVIEGGLDAAKVKTDPADKANFAGFEKIAQRTTQKIQARLAELNDPRAGLYKITGTDTESLAIREPPNTSTDYAATLAAREKGFNVGSGLVINLADTYKKDYDKSFGERNRIIGLTEGYIPPVPKAAAPPPVQTVTPQRPRPRAATGEQGGLFANPQYQKEMAPESGEKTAYTLELFEGARPKNYFIGLGQEPRQNNLASLFGVAPKEPRNLTQEQVNALTPEEYQIYLKEYEVYNQYASYATAQSKAINEANRIISKENWQNNKAGLKKFIAEARKEGITTISINSKSGYKEVPIGRAIYEILKTDDIIGIGTPLVIPEGYTVVGSPGVNMAYYPESPTTPYGPDEPYKGIFKNPKQGENPLLFALREQKPQPPLKTLQDIGEGFATGFGRTSVYLTATFPQAFIDIAKTGDPLAGEKTLETDEAELKRLGVMPSAPSSILSGVGTGRSPYYNIAETIGEIGPGLEGIKGLIRNPFRKAPKLAEKPQVSAPVATEPLVISGRVYKPTNMFRQPGAEIKALTEADTAGRFATERISLGRTPLAAGETIPARDAIGGRIIKKIVPVEQVAIPKQVELDPLYRPKVQVRRAPEIGTFRADEKLFRQDTAKTFGETKVELGAGSLVKAEVARDALGGIILKSPVPSRPLGAQRVELGRAMRTETRVPLGEGKTRTIRSGVEEIRISLGEGKKVTPPKEPGKLSPARDIFRLAREPAVSESGTVRGAKNYGNLREQILGIEKQKQVKAPKAIEEDTTYSPTKNLPRTRAKEIKTYRIQTDKLIGRTENPLGKIFERSAEPLVKEGTPKQGIKGTLQKIQAEKEFPKVFEPKAFERSAIDAEKRRAANLYRFTEKVKVELGKGTTQRVPIREGAVTYGLGRGRTFFVSRSTGASSPKRFTPPRPPPEEGPKGRGRQELVLEKPAETKGFKTTTISLGKGEVTLIAGSGATAAPLPLVIRAEEEQNPITNSTGTNSTQPLPPPEPEPPQETEQPPSILEPPAITESRPASVFAAAATTSLGVKFGLEAAQARRSAILTQPSVKPITETRQKQKTMLGFPTPSAEPTRLAQPSAFKPMQGQPQRFKQPIPFPTPTPLTLKQPQPFVPKLRQPQTFPPRFPKPPVPLPGFGFGRVKDSKKRKAKDLEPNAFVGNVSDINVALGFNRREIVAGIERSARVYKKDVKFAIKRGGFEKFVTQRKGSIISRTQRSILEREDKKKVKREKKKRGGFY